MRVESCATCEMDKVRREKCKNWEAGDVDFIYKKFGKLRKDVEKINEWIIKFILISRFFIDKRKNYAIIHTKLSLITY